MLSMCIFIAAVSCWYRSAMWTAVFSNSGEPGTTSIPPGITGTKAVMIETSGLKGEGAGARAPPPWVPSRARLRTSCSRPPQQLRPVRVLVGLGLRHVEYGAHDEPPPALGFALLLAVE